MSRENVEVVARMYDYGRTVLNLLLQGADLSDQPWLSLWHPECVLQEVAEVPDAATYHGREGVARYFQRLGELFDEVRFTPVEIVEGSGGVFAAIEMWTRSKAGVVTEERPFQIFRLQDGMIIYAMGYLDRKEALKAVGLAE
jgi:ketosteroid isomerase-like protein